MWWIIFFRVLFPLFALLLSRECFTTKLKSTCKNSGTFDEKKFNYLPTAYNNKISKIKLFIYVENNFAIIISSSQEV